MFREPHFIALTNKSWCHCRRGTIYCLINIFHHFNLIVSAHKLLKNRLVIAVPKASFLHATIRRKKTGGNYLAIFVR